MLKGMLTIAKATSKPHVVSVRDRMSLARAHIIERSPVWEMLRDMQLGADSRLPPYNLSSSTPSSLPWSLLVTIRAAGRATQVTLLLLTSVGDSVGGKDLSLSLVNSYAQRLIQKLIVVEKLNRSQSRRRGEVPGKRPPERPQVFSYTNICLTARATGGLERGTPYLALINTGCVLGSGSEVLLMLLSTGVGLGYPRQWSRVSPSDSPWQKSRVQQSSGLGSHHSDLILLQSDTWPPRPVRAVSRANGD
ncbi:hypothetical protein AAFF_G00000470 [Aldrovandia affinis]|uniref:Uncharacterized protein n=1 Tax=Aldrovandia affinis TaxID=143900 RepID=A0AAD7TE41_9TELE|nr:hypothetical protein AAFF_G00000470 [Aldrovandia affinis]